MLNLLVYLLVSTVRVLLGIEYILFLGRAIFSWIFMSEDSVIGDFLYMATEPLIVPIRLLLSKVEALQNLPFDIPFWITSILIIFIPMLLPTVTL